MKKIANMFYTIFFVAATIFLAYCFFEYREDVATMICASIVMLIATFLFIDVLVSLYKDEKKDYLEKAQQRQDTATAEIQKTLQEAIKFEKALYIINRRLLDQKQQEQSEQPYDQSSETAKFKVL